MSDLGTQQNRQADIANAELAARRSLREGQLAPLSVATLLDLHRVVVLGSAGLPTAIQKVPTQKDALDDLSSQEPKSTVMASQKS